ncbi:MAG: hypothetical protein ACP5NV_05830 [Candidatus Woesearchaeota archaeon]
MTILLVGCGSPKPSAKLSTAILRESEIRSGQATDLILDAMNDGNIPTDVKFIISTESPEKVLLSIQSPLEFTLQPKETTGNKIVKVTATTDTVSTSYLITVKLTDGTTIFDTKNIILKVNKD